MCCFTEKCYDVPKLTYLGIGRQLQHIMLWNYYKAKLTFHQILTVDVHKYRMTAA